MDRLLIGHHHGRDRSIVLVTYPQKCRNQSRLPLAGDLNLLISILIVLPYNPPILCFSSYLSAHPNAPCCSNQLIPTLLLHSPRCGVEVVTHLLDDGCYPNSRRWTKYAGHLMEEGWNGVEFAGERERRCGGKYGTCITFPHLIRCPVFRGG